NALEQLERDTRPLQGVVFSIDDQTQFIGRIQSRGIGEDGTISLSCTDYREYFVSSYVDPAIHINKGERLESALSKILGVHEVQSFEKGFFAHKASASPQSQGLNTAQGFDPQTMKVQERRPKENEGAWQMAQRYCERSGCLIELSDSRNRVALAQPSYEQAPQFFVKRSKLASNAA